MTTPTPSPSPLEGYITTAEASAEFGISQPRLTYLCRLGPEKGGLQCQKVTSHLWIVELQSLKEYEERVKQKAKDGKLTGPRRSRNPANKKAKP